LFLSFRADLDRRIGKRGAGRDENRNASSYYTFHHPKYTPLARAANRQRKPDRTREGMIPPAFTRDSNAFAGIELELLRQARVPEPVRSIVSEAWITDSISAFAEGLRRILIKDIVDSNSDAGALE
jgi:hypothetical protein